MIDRPLVPMLYIDANVFVEFFEGVQQRVDRLEVFFDHLRGHPGRAVTSELALAELLGKEAPGTTWEAQKRFYTGLLCENTFIGLYPVTREILIETGELRRSAATLGRSLKLADAIHVVTASSLGCLSFLSADRRIFCTPPLRPVIPDDAGLTEIERLLDA